MEILRRSLALPPSLRDAEPGKGIGRVGGYAAKFGSDYRLSEDMVETIAPGAFARTLRENPDVRLLADHDSACLLARTASGTLQLSEDSTGLAFLADLPDTTVGRDVRSLVARGDLSGCSFGFFVVRQSMSRRNDGLRVCTLEDVDLLEVSIVSFPAYEETEVSLRARKARSPRPRLELYRRKLRILDLS
jgi:Escherichia/Staphylococcus phage prohead protease